MVVTSTSVASAWWHKTHVCPRDELRMFLTLRQLMWAKESYESAQFLYYTQRPWTALGWKEVFNAVWHALPKAPDTIIVRLTATSFSILLLPQEDLFRSSPIQTDLSSDNHHHVRYAGDTLRLFVFLYVIDGIFHNSSWTVHVIYRRLFVTTGRWRN